MKANATRANVFKIHTNKSIQHYPIKPIGAKMRVKGTDMYNNTHIQTVAIEFKRRQEQEPSALRTIVELIVMD